MAYPLSDAQKAALKTLARAPGEIARLSSKPGGTAASIHWAPAAKLAELGLAVIDHKTDITGTIHRAILTNAGRREARERRIIQ